MFFQVWTNADCAHDPNSWQFVSGYVFLIGGDAISWQSRKQPPMVLSSIKSEYISTIATTKEALWLRQLLRDLSFSPDGPTCLHYDNQSCIKFTQNACFHDLIEAHWITISLLTRKNWSPRIGTSFHINWNHVDWYSYKIFA